MDNENEFKRHYTYNNIIYSFVSISDVHDKLQNDPEFFESLFAYLIQTMSSNEAIRVSNQENDPIPGNFSWIKGNIKLLLQKYDERRDKFRDPKIKKKTWAQIIKECAIENYAVTEEILDHEMRNLKSYKSIKDNNKKTDGSSACQIEPFVPTTDSAPDNILKDSSNGKTRKQKNTRAKAFYDLRKKRLDCEERKINALNELKKAMNEHNNIQKERNEILRQLLQSNITG